MLQSICSETLITTRDGGDLEREREREREMLAN